MNAIPIFLLAASTLVAAGRTQGAADDFLAGYAAAVLAREFQLPSARVTAAGGVITVPHADLGDRDPGRVRRELAAIPGVRRVDFAGESAAAEAALEEPRSFLARSPLLFEPLHADPRWPHFSAAWHDYRDEPGLDNIAAVSFGESFSLLRWGAAEASRWELGLQAGVFSIFDLDADSFDLVNADYFVGPVVTWRDGSLSAMGRVYHQSSHLGDEYLLRAEPERINLSYEVFDLLASVDVTSALRVYGGAGYVLHSDTPLENWLLQSGVELFGAPVGGSGFRPLAACDLQMREETDWRGDVSARAGIEFSDPGGSGGRMQILLEYYRGRSPNGQFFTEDIELFGLGVHLYF